MNKTSSKFVYFLALGYTSLIILVLASSAIFFHYENQISSSFKNYARTIGLQNKVTDLFYAATQRSILMVRMIHSQDAFEADDLQMQMHHQESIIDGSIIALENASKTPAQKALLQDTLKIMEKNKAFQDEVFNLIIDGRQDQAMQQLVDVTLPVQRNVFAKLTLLKQEYTSKSNTTKVALADIIDDMRQMILMVSIPIILSLLLIASVTIQRLKKFAISQQQLMQNLEAAVHKRTQQLLLDRQLIQHLNEAICIFDEDGHSQLSNRKFQDVLKAGAVISTDSVWRVLQELFQDLPIDAIRERLHEKHAWRGETSIHDLQEQFMMIDLSRIEDEQLPKPYYSLILTDISELKRAQKQLEYTANYDEVTTLPNRVHFKDHLENILTKRSDPLVLLYLDLDDFKWVNDNLGHAAGDHFLREVGYCFHAQLEKHHFLARLGGDEFVIVIPNALSEYEIERLSQQLLLSLRQVNKAHYAEHEIGCSIGVAQYPHHGENVESLMKSADYAMYQAKKSGRNQFCLFSNELKETLQHRQQLEQNLKLAVKDQAFFVHYQPQYCLRTLELTGAEALARWNHRGQNISPAEFIPLAENFGLINDIGEFVFETSVKQLSRWQKTPIKLARMGINASATQLLAGHFGQFIEDVLDKHQVSARQIDIEVTESVMMKNIEKNSPDANCLTLLQGKGVEISIDDFGTGYSSLSYIKHLKIDRIKIDKGFIDDLEDKLEARSIVEAIIRMAHSLELTVVAEGIETQKQLEILRELECDEGQGYLFSKPLSAEEFEAKCLYSQSLTV